MMRLASFATLAATLSPTVARVSRVRTSARIVQLHRPRSQRQPMALHAHTRQRGVALFIALVVLLIITLVGVSSLQSTRIEERMAANSLDRDTAFQAAEAALATGETTIEALPAAFEATFTANTDGYYEPVAATAPPRWETVDWLNDGALPETAGDLGDVVEQPKYIVEYVARVELEDEASANLGQRGELEGEQVDMFRVSSYGHGRSPETRVLLQSTYGKIAN